MVLCTKCYVPCCDFCTHVIHKMGEINGKIVSLAPIGCKLHKDEEHQNIAASCYYCDDFHCFHVK